MLRKLFKYDFRCMARSFIPLMVAYLAVSGIFRVMMMIDGQDVSLPLTLFFIISTILYITLNYAVGLYAFIGNIQRYSKNLFSDEGYLMLTLPVKPWHHIVSKLISAFVWFAITFGVQLVSVIIIVGNIDLVKNIGKFLKENGIDILKALSEHPAVVISVIAMIFTGFIYMMLMFYFAITLGKVATNTKKNGGVVIATILIIIANIFLFVYSVVFSETLVEKFNITSASGTITFVCSYYSVLLLIGSAIYFAVTNFLISRKLNLE